MYLGPGSEEVCCEQGSKLVIAIPAGATFAAVQAWMAGCGSCTMPCMAYQAAQTGSSSSS